MLIANINNIMKVLVLSGDTKLVDLIRNQIEWESNFEFLFSSDSDPVEVLSVVCQNRPSILVFDDDLVRPSSPQVLRNIKKLHSDVHTIFITSDEGIEIGRSVSQIGIQYYTIKEVEKNDFRDSLESISRMCESKKY